MVLRNWSIAAVAVALLAGCSGSHHASVVPKATSNSAAAGPGQRTKHSLSLSSAERSMMFANVDAAEQNLLGTYAGASDPALDAIRQNGYANYTIVVVTGDGVYHSNDPTFSTAGTGLTFDWSVFNAGASGSDPSSPPDGGGGGTVGGGGGGRIPLSGRRFIRTYGYNPGTGPYRRVFTGQQTPWYAQPGDLSYHDYNPTFIEGTVQTYCRQGIYDQTSDYVANVSGYKQESGQAYLGGRPFDGGTEVDAGLQYNRFTQGDVNGGNDTYTPYLRIGASNYIFDVYDQRIGQLVSRNVHIPCGAPVALLFGLQGSHGYAYTGPTLSPDMELYMLYNASNTHTYELFFDPGLTNIGGWQANCTQCVMKMMTTVAEQHPSSLPDRFNSGYSFHATWVGNLASCRYANPMPTCWTALGYGAFAIPQRFCSDYPGWQGVQSYSTTECGNSPPNVNVQVTNFTQTGEDVTIVLPSPAPVPTPVPTGQPKQCLSCGYKRMPL
jgi:hypothetical protein